MMGFFKKQEQAQSHGLLAASTHSGFYFSSSFHNMLQFRYVKNLFSRLPIIMIIYIKILNCMIIIHFSPFLLPVYDQMMMLFCKLIHIS